MLYQWILDEMVRCSRDILGEALTGVYLHGSMAMDCFNPDKSDIDLILVVETAVSDRQKMLLMKEIVHLNEQAPPKGIELSVVKREHCNPFVYPTPFELHFSPAHLHWFRKKPQEYIEKMNGEDKDLAAHFTVIRNYGIVLWGEAIEAVFAPVPRADYIDSIFFDIQNAKEEILEHPVYVILNLCRVLAYIQEGLCLSKKDGGQWGMEHCPAAYRAVISQAAECYAGNQEMELEPGQAAEFAKGMLELIGMQGNSS